MLWQSQHQNHFHSGPWCHSAGRTRFFTPHRLPLYVCMFGE